MRQLNLLLTVLCIFQLTPRFLAADEIKKSDGASIEEALAPNKAIGIVQGDTLSSKAEKETIINFAKQLKQTPINAVANCGRVFELAHLLAGKLMPVKTPSEALLVSNEFLYGREAQEHNEFGLRKAAHDIFIKVAETTKEWAKTDEALTLIERFEANFCDELQKTFQARNKKLKSKIDRLRSDLLAQGQNSEQNEIVLHTWEEAVRDENQLIKILTKAENDEFGNFAPFVAQSQLEKHLNTLLQSFGQPQQSLPSTRNNRGPGAGSNMLQNNHR